MGPIDVAPADLEAVRAILRRHVPDREVLAFGSRVTWTAKQFSDLDLAVLGDSPLSSAVRAALAEDFDESDLPFKVDVVDWATTSEAFRKIIQRDAVVVRKGDRKGVGPGVSTPTPSGWSVVPFQEAIDFQEGPGILAEDFRPSGVPLIRLSGLDRGGRVLDGCNFLDEEAVKRRWDHFRVRSGDVLLSTSASLGRIAIVDDRSAGAVPYTGIIRMRPLTAAVHAPFIQFLLESPHFQAQVEAMGVGSVIRHFGPSHLRQMNVLLPDVPSQRAIARILSALDDKIELNRRTNETLEAMARALFKSWFVDFDPVRAKAAGRPPIGMDAETMKLFPSEFAESELREIPKAWSVAPVYDLATYVNGAAYKAFQPNDERRGLPIIKIAELKAGVTSQTRFSEVEMPEKYRLRTGDILFSWSGNPDTSIDTFVWAHGPAWLNQHIFRVELHAADERPFVLATLKYLRPVFAEIARNKQTTGLGHVTAGDLQRLLIVKPDRFALSAWDHVASPIFDAAFHNELEALTLARLRDTLLPALLSGELRVGGAERVLEAQA